MEQLWKESGYLKANKFYKYLKDNGHKKTMKEVKDFLNKQLSIQITKPVKKNKIYPTIVGVSVNNIYQMDIMVYNRYAVNGYKYILGVIDVHSRYASCRPLKPREQREYMPQILSIFKEMGTPNNLNCDNEFNTNEFKEYCNKNNITLWFSNPEETTGKNAIIERFWRTLANLIQAYKINNKGFNWVKNLNLLIKKYNQTTHGTIKAQPVKVFKGQDTNKQNIIYKPTTLNIGDTVRIKTFKKTFDKGDTWTYSKATYTIQGKDKEKDLMI